MSKNELLRNLELAMIGSCHCLTKTPKAEHHKPECLYRILSEARAALTQPAQPAEGGEAASPFRAALMGHGRVAIGQCKDTKSGTPGVIYLDMGDEQRPIDADTSDLFTPGSVADESKVLACIYFATPDAVMQSITFLRELLADQFGVTTPPASQEQAPIPMVLHCPKCGKQHIDAADPMGETEGWLGAWENPPHRSHLCHGCGTIWRPADVPTTGVTAVSTKGKSDTWGPGQEQAQPAQPAEGGEAAAFLLAVRDTINRSKAVPVGSAVSIDPVVTREFRKFMRDEPSAFDGIPWGEFKALASAQPITDDQGHGEVYTTPPASHVPEADFGNNQPASQEQAS